MLKLAVLVSLLAAACTPEDVLRSQGRTLRSTDYVQAALDEKRKEDAKKEQEDQQRRLAEAEVKTHADRAEAHMDLGEYEAAAKAFKDAYRLSQEPTYLIRLGDAMRATGDCVEAQTMYAQYLHKVPEAKDRPAIQAKIDEAAACEKQAGSDLPAIRKHYKDGVTHYDLAEYDEAAGEFKEAYRLSKDPTYLFNVAQAYRMAKKCDDALSFYQRFLTIVPDAPNRDRVEAHITAMKSCAKAR